MSSENELKGYFCESLKKFGCPSKSIKEIKAVYDGKTSGTIIEKIESIRTPLIKRFETEEGYKKEITRSTLTALDLAILYEFPGNKLNWGPVIGELGTWDDHTQRIHPFPSSGMFAASNVHKEQFRFYLEDLLKWQKGIGDAKVKARFSKKLIELIFGKKGFFFWGADDKGKVITLVELFYRRYELTRNIHQFLFKNDSRFQFQELSIRILDPILISLAMLDESEKICDERLFIFNGQRNEFNPEIKRFIKIEKS